MTKFRTNNFVKSNFHNIFALCILWELSYAITKDSYILNERAVESTKNTPIKAKKKKKNSRSASKYTAKIYKKIVIHAKGFFTLL